MKKYSILFLNKYYYPIIGGVESVVKQYAESLTEHFDVTVLTISKKFTLKTKTEIIHGVTVVRCSSLGTFFSMPLSITFFLWFFRLRNTFYIIHFHEPFPLASLFSIVPKNCNRYILTWHSDIVRQKYFRGLFEYFQKKLCKKSDIITTTSPTLCMNSSVLRFYRKKTVILPLSINIKDYSEYSPDRKSKKDGYILSLGRLSYYKGISFLLEAYKRSEIKTPLVIVGEGHEANHIKEFIMQNRKMHIEFLHSFVSEEKKKELLAHCKFFVFPSIYESEAFGIIQLEAMIMGKPVINTNISTGVPWVSVHGETGLTVQPKDTKALAEAMKKLDNNKALRERLGKNAIERVRNMFSLEQTMAQYKALIDRLII